MVCAPLFFTTQLIHTSTPTILTNDPSTSTNFHLPISHPYVPTKSFLKSPPRLSSFIPYSSFTFPFSYSVIKVFLIPQSFSQFRLLQGPSEQCSDKDACDQHCKLSTQPSPKPSTYYCFHALLSPSQEMLLPYYKI